MVLTTEKKALIWKTLNDTRGKVSPTQYKNYVFGIMFYKYLSEKAQKWLQSFLRNGEDWNSIWGQDSTKAAQFMQSKLGYVIQPGDMFSDWRSAIDDDKFTINMVRDSITHFDQGIRTDAKEDFSGIFSSMDLESSSLGNNDQTKSATMIDWINFIDQFDTDENYDVMGDLYEYLIGMFAFNSGGDKGGEFFTPHEISDIMAQILTAGRRDTEHYSLYDPAVGSGSLLLTTASYLKNSNHRGVVKYYGQELITETYNMTRMNLIMHGIEYNDIDIRNGDTLNGDWPDGVVNGVDSPRMFDAVMANPPYSLKWDNTGREDDPRFKMGIAPKTKADYAFLLHGLYHLNQNGKMAIVLPHGVLFRGAAEGRIRKNLLMNHNISAIIGLPAKIFTNTSIPTLIMVLEKNRKDDDVLFIDGSKGFEKLKNTNRLRQEDIDHIVKAYLNRDDEDKFSHVATMREIEENDYNLNIPRYVDTFEPEPDIDIQSVKNEISNLDIEIEKNLKEFRELESQLVDTGVQENESKK